MNRHVLWLLVGFLMAGCGGRKSLPAGRLHQPGGRISFVAPEGWYKNKLTGLDFIVVSADPDRGIEPNIFVDVVMEDAQLADAVARLEEAYSSRTEFEITGQENFKTDASLSGLRFTSNRLSKKKLPLTSIHYLIEGEETVVAITCTAAASVFDRYETVFDSVASSVEIAE